MFKDGNKPLHTSYCLKYLLNENNKSDVVVASKIWLKLPCDVDEKDIPSFVDEEEYWLNENGKLRIHRVVTWHYVKKKLTIPCRLRSSFVLVVAANF